MGIKLMRCLTPFKDRACKQQNGTIKSRGCEDGKEGNGGGDLQMKRRVGGKGVDVKGKEELVG